MEILTFGPYRFEPRIGRLIKNGHWIKLQPKTAALLSTLLERPGEVVKRTELQTALWPEGTHVDFELSIKAVVKKLRHALSDSAEEPVYIQNVYGEGYRFMATVKPVIDTSLEYAAIPPSQTNVATSRTRLLPIRLSTREKMVWLSAAAAIVLLAGGWWLLARNVRANPPWLLVTALDNRTGEPLLDESVPFLLEREASNSARIYVVQQGRVQDTLKLMRREPILRVDESLGREVALRDGGIDLVASVRAERLGSSYLLIVGVREVSSGRLVSGGSRSARGLNEIPATVRELASMLVRSTSKRPAAEGAVPLDVQHVTTPSLRACQLFSRSVMEFARPNYPVAQQLAMEAVAEDGKFAMAHLWVAYTGSFQSRLSAESQKYLQSAVALSGFTTDRERQFILAIESYIHHDYEEAVRRFRRMLAVYPDDPWALEAFIHSLQYSGRVKKAMVETYRVADLRPNSGSLAVYALNTAVTANDLGTAKRYRDRLLRMAEGHPEALHQDYPHTATAFGVHEFWVEDRLDEMRRELSKVNEQRTLSEPDTRTVSTCFASLGRLRDAGSAIDKDVQGPRAEEVYRPLLAYLRDDHGALYESLRAAPSSYYSRFLEVRADWSPLVFQKRVQPESPYQVVLFLAEARYAAIHGNFQTAAQKVQAYENSFPGWKVNPEPMIDRVMLARAEEESGDDTAALATLQAADLPRATLFWAGACTGAAWHKVRYEEARVLRKLGRQSEAERIEAALRRDLRLADADHPILVRLNQSDRKPFDVY